MLDCTTREILVCFKESAIEYESLRIGGFYKVGGLDRVWVGEEEFVTVQKLCGI